MSEHHIIMFDMVYPTKKNKVVIYVGTPCHDADIVYSSNRIQERESLSMWISEKLVNFLTFQCILLRYFSIYVALLVGHPDDVVFLTHEKEGHCLCWNTTLLC